MLISQPSTIASDYAYCEKIIKRHSKSFYYAFSNLPKEKARAVYAIYAFCRIADDSVDENKTSGAQLAALDQLTAELNRFGKHCEIDHPLWRALRDVFDRFDMDLQPFYDQLVGQRMDIHFMTPANLSALETYSKYVAGSVGRMLLPIIASDKKCSLNSAAENLGIAMQITNILRDVGEDYREKGRIYLPQEEMDRYHYNELLLAEGRITQGFMNMWEYLATRAEFLYADFTQHIEDFDKDSRFAVLSSAHVYQGILNSVRKSGYDCFNRKNYVTPVEMAKLVARASM
ncbi:phytoene/squalene synthase family protein [Sporosarcina obsidiansis]|uniref:phytoene/squalene synthase family protein n=1 Tax=Sporosarcina obsidiansis TaxID=2660748 RepID=UPI00129AAEF9|nr:phytoene/squalene synthase family protein [Sporosarcina obsidiansis]